MAVFLTHAWGVDKKGSLRANALVHTDVTDPVREELTIVREIIRSETTSGIGMADEAISHAIGCGGKVIRPALFLLSARLFDDSSADRDALARTAAAIELVHAASLMHDDVVDGARMRRGRESTNFVFGDKASVLAGDFIWSTASRLIVSVGNQNLTKAVVDCVREITLGEILELAHNRDVEVDEGICLKIIEGKTGSLFSLAATAGAIVKGAGEGAERALASFGRHAGIAYQLTDDALDYSSNDGALGKDTGTDLAGGTPTYPFVVALERSDDRESTILKGTLVSKNGSGLQDVTTIVKDLGGVEDTLRLAKEQSRMACDALSVFPDGPAKTALCNLAEFASERKA